MDNKFPGKDITLEDCEFKFPLATKKKQKEILFSKKIKFNSKTIPVIAGPNTLENRDMILRCCDLLEKKKIGMLRAGVYKPLTFPYRSKKYFELGDKAAKILEEIKKNYDLLIVSEIMEEKKIDFINDYIDVFQIGSRNMQNFPLITEVSKKRKPKKEIMTVTGRADVSILFNGSLNDINNGVNELKKIKDIVSTETLIEVEVDLGW